MKKSICILLMVMFAVSMPIIARQAVHANDDEIIQSGIHYKLNTADNTAIVSGADGNVTGDVTIPATIDYGSVTYHVVGVGNNAFWNNRDIKSITLPHGIKIIGQGAFKGCQSLTSFVFPDGVTVIESQCFFNCGSLTSVSLPNTVTVIGSGAFGLCRNLTSVNIPSSVKTIGNGAFNQCSSLTSVVIPNSVTTIELSTFFGCKALSNVTLPSTVTSIGESAFAGCNLKSVTIPNSVIKLGNYAFRDNKSLQSASVPESLKDIGGGIFEGTPITAVKIRGANGKTTSSKEWYWLTGLSPQRKAELEAKEEAQRQFKAYVASVDPNSMSWPAPDYSRDLGDGSTRVSWKINGITQSATITRVVCKLLGDNYNIWYNVYANSAMENFKEYIDAEAYAYFYLLSGKERTRGLKFSK